jgi:uridine kinase
MKLRPKLIAIVGGSGAGKSWLSERLVEVLSYPVMRLSLDDFYRDQSHVPPALRSRINFDHPKVIDWKLAEAVLKGCRSGRRVRLPNYCFITHTRQRKFKIARPRPVILVDGLWLLWRTKIRRMFDLRIFLHCPAHLRLRRRLARDKAHRGRNAASVRRQFSETVAPMHKRFVAPQAKWADVVFRQPPRKREIRHLVTLIEKEVQDSGPLEHGAKRDRPKIKTQPLRQTPRTPKSHVPVPARPGRDTGRAGQFALPCCPATREPVRCAHPSRL